MVFFFCLFCWWCLFRCRDKSYAACCQFCVVLGIIPKRFTQADWTNQKYHTISIVWFGFGKKKSKLSVCVGVVMKISKSMWLHLFIFDCSLFVFCCSFSGIIENTQGKQLPSGTISLAYSVQYHKHISMTCLDYSNHSKYFVDLRYYLRPLFPFQTIFFPFRSHSLSHSHNFAFMQQTIWIMHTKKCVCRQCRR